MVQTAEGAIAAAQEMAQRILTLATQGANGTMGTTDRSAIQNEMKQLLTAINSSPVEISNPPRCCMYTFEITSLPLEVLVSKGNTPFE
jgi:hypothetical protein